MISNKKSNLGLKIRLLLLSALLLPVCAQAEPLEVREDKNAAPGIADLMRALNEQKRNLEEQEQRILRQKTEMEKQERALETQKQDFDKLQRQVSTITGQAVTPISQGQSTAAPADSAPPTNQQILAEGEQVGTDRKPLPAEKPPQIAAEIEEGGVLLQRGKMVFTPSLEYTRSSATRVAIEGFSIVPALNIGSFEVSQVGRNIITTAIAARLGLTNRFEIEGKVPFVYRNDETRARPIGAGSSVDVLSSVDGYGLGDVEAGAHYQINSGLNGWPFLIANLRFKSTTGTNPFELDKDARGFLTELPTGTGFYSVQPSITAIYPTDPAVFYSNVGYLYNAPRDFGGTTGEIDPGDSISSTFGMSITLNEKSSFSLGYGHSTVFKNKQNGVTVPATTYLQVGTLDFGYSYVLTPRASLNVNVSAGITEDAPDSRFTFRVPIAFDLY